MHYDVIWWSTSHGHASLPLQETLIIMKSFQCFTHDNLAIFGHSSYVVITHIGPNTAGPLFWL